MEKVLISVCLCSSFLFCEGEKAFNVTSLHELKSANTVRQSFEESCGAAALATIMGLFGTKKSEAEIMDKFATTNMVSFTQLADTAKEFGYEVEGYKVSRENFEKLTIPVIAKVERERSFPHFVVVLNHSGDFTTVLDPNYGRYIITKDEFCNIWADEGQGYILIVVPNLAFAKPDINLELPNKNLFLR